MGPLPHPVTSVDDERAPTTARHLALVKKAGPPKSKILVVEDDDDDAHLIRRCLFLSAPNLQVDVATSAEAALFQLRGGEYCAAIVDYRLGKTKGTELIEWCRSAGLGIPMILLTGQGGARVDLEAMEKGACDYLEKESITPEVLERSLNRGGKVMIVTRNRHGLEFVFTLGDGAASRGFGKCVSNACRASSGCSSMISMRARL